MKKVLALIVMLCSLSVIFSCGGGGGSGSDNEDGLNDNGGGFEGGGETGTGSGDVLSDVGVMKSIILDSGLGFSYAITTTEKIIVLGLTTDGEQMSSISIPSYIDGKEVVAIGEAAFEMACSGLTSIILPDTVKDIRHHAFDRCRGLTSINIPSNIIRIGAYAFNECKQLTMELSFPSSLKILGSEAFFNCSSLYGTLTIPNGIKYLESLTFSECSGITTVIMQDTTPPIAGSNIFRNCSALTAIRVPSEAVDTYKSAPGWSTYSSKIVGY